MRHLFTCEPARKSGAARCFFAQSTLCHLALKQTFALEFIKSWLFRPKPCSPVQYLCVFIIGPAVTGLFSCISYTFPSPYFCPLRLRSIQRTFLKLLPFDLLYFDLVLNSESPCDLSYHYLNASVYPEL